MAFNSHSSAPGNRFTAFYSAAEEITMQREQHRADADGKIAALPGSTLVAGRSR